ncbi:hypothetical protein LEMLEM_LOCUS25721, partial [Lemmus lemmus]
SKEGTWRGRRRGGGLGGLDPPSSPAHHPSPRWEAQVNKDDWPRTADLGVAWPGSRARVSQAHCPSDSAVCPDTPSTQQDRGGTETAPRVTVTRRRLPQLKCPSPENSPGPLHSSYAWGFSLLLYAFLE